MALLLVAGAGVRIFAASPGAFQWEGSPADTVTAEGLRAVRQGAEAELERARIREEPLASGERIDPNKADVLQLDRLPRVGESLAKRIVAWREAHGPFRTLADLDSVPGVGPGLLESLAPHLSLPPAPVRAASERSRRSSGASMPETKRPQERVAVNRASPEELEALPGIGPALARRIVSSRESEGAFRTLEELGRVSGIGPVMLERLAPLVSFER
jgi:competence protein ComEA